MKRRTWHIIFAALVLACAVATLVQGLRLRARVSLNEALAAAAVAPVAQTAPTADAPAGSAPESGSVPAVNAAAAPPQGPAELQLARATALARAGTHDAAFKLYAALIAAGPQDPVARHALYNLGNLYLRQGLGLQAPAPGEAAPRTPSADSAPLVELAKQRYRDLLRATPDDWDARYNLERALRLAPEEHAANVEEDQVPVERRRVMLRGMEAGDLP